MKLFGPFFAFFLLFLLPISGNAQRTTLKLKSGTYDVSSVREKRTFDAQEKAEAAQFRIIHFESIPSLERKKELANEHIFLLEYLPDNAFFARVTNQSNFNVLGANDRVIQIETNFKLSTNLFAKNYPHWTLFGTDKIELSGFYFEGLSTEVILGELKALNAEVVSIVPERKTVLIRVPLDRLDAVYASNYFHYFEELAAPEVPENEPGRLLHRSNSLWTEYQGGNEYNGEGITVMVQDDGIVGPHIDYTGRVDQSNCGGCSTSTANDHGDHVVGILGGAGNLNPDNRGMAHGAEILIFSSSNANYYSVPALNASADLVITSKSYGDGCNSGYSSLTRDLDQQVRQLPELIHVFSCGNSGTQNCGYGAGAGWGNITGGHKSGKNVIAVGNLTGLDNIANSSSRGPATDGRIKPDICAVGTSVMSTLPNNLYGTKTGTSMACPGVAGTITQLYEAYKDLNGGVNPNSGLIKASVLNTAEDLGNDGPDFTYGWGRINARRALDLLSNNQYYSGTITQGANQSNTIAVPAGVKEVRIMTYWMDYEGSVNASPALVNDIDMVVTDPTNQPFEPWVLNSAPSAASLSALAVRGPDHLNNMEQVTIVNPVAGNYTVELTGFGIPQGPQEYFVLYYFIYDEIVVTHPNGGEGIVPAQTTAIHWDASDDVAPFNVEYSLDNGASWINIGTASATSRQMNWVPPTAAVSGLAKVRVTRNAVSDESDEVFSVIRVPQNLTVQWACADSLNLSWSAVSGATGYEVSALGAMYMDSIGTTSLTNLTVPFSETLTGWFSVRALGPDDARGKRANAIQKLPGQFGCLWGAPTAQFDTDCDNAGEGYCLNFLNTSINTAGGAQFMWYFPGGVPATSTLENPEVCYSAPGFHDVALVVTNIGGSDSVYQTNAIYLAPAQTIPYVEGFESLTNFINQDAWSVNNPGNNATFQVSTSAALSGAKSARLGNYGQNAGQEDELISGPIDLSSLSVGDEMTLSFRYAYRKRISSTFERLQVYATSNCADSWVVRKTIQGDQLSSVVEGTSWTPTSEEDWTTVHVTNITDNYFTGDFRFKFNFLSGDGNNLFLDNINLYEGQPSDDVVGITEDEFNLLGFSVFPNPTENELTVQFGLEAPQTVQLVITDVSGKEVQSTQILGASGSNAVVMNVNQLSAGVYILQAKGAGTQEQIRFIKK